MLDLDARQKAIVTAILQQYLPAAAVWAFGSRAEGRARHTSDLDLVIVAPERIPADLLLEVKEAFDDSDLDIKVDVARLTDLPASFQQHIHACHTVIKE